MVFPDEFKQRLEALQAVVQRNLAQIDNLDRRFQEVKKQHLDLFSQAINEMTQIISARYTMPDFSVEAPAEKQCSLTFDENIKRFGQYMEEIDARLHRYERALSEACPAASSSSSSCTLNTDTPKRFGRSPAKSRQTRARLAAELQSVTDVERPIDQKRGAYCICHKTSYGLMIGCDNPNCKIEWFHFACVGLKGKWYCPDCAPLQKDCKGK